MHEMSLMRNVLDMVLAECQGKGVEKVEAIYLSIGEASDVVEHKIPSLFRFLAKETIAAEAEVYVERIPVYVHCLQCSNIFPVNTRDESTWTCPRCGAHKKYRLFSGREFWLDKIDVRRRGEAPDSAAEGQEG